MRARLVPVVAVALLAACGGGPPSPESVVRAWSNALNSDDDEGAAELFAPRAEVIQGRSAYVLDTQEEAIAFNRAIPCSGEIVEIETDGDTVEATFRLADRETRPCDAPGAESTARIRVREGKIVLWQQLPGGGGSGEAMARLGTERSSRGRVHPFFTRT